MDMHVKVMFGIPLAVIAVISMMQPSGRTGPEVGADAAGTPVSSSTSAATGVAPPIAKASEVGEEAQPTRIAASVLEQAIFDAFPETAPTTVAAKKKAVQASDFLAAAINSNGHLCAKPVDMQQADASHYGIRCVTRRSGEGRSNYLVNVQTGEVTPI